MNKLLYKISPQLLGILVLIYPKKKIKKCNCFEKIKHLARLAGIFVFVDDAFNIYIDEIVAPLFVKGLIPQ
jgi:hypothetical protein